MLELNGSCHFGDLWQIETLNAPSKCSSSAGNKFILLSVDTHILALHTVMCSLTFNDVLQLNPLDVGSALIGQHYCSRF